MPFLGHVGCCLAVAVPCVAGVCPAALGQEGTPAATGTLQLLLPRLEAEGKGLRVNTLDVIRLQRQVSPGRTSRLRVCLVCGLASPLLSLIADKRKSFEFKESNHCSCYEATIWKAFVDFLLKESSVPFHTSLLHWVTFSVLSFFFF